MLLSAQSASAQQTDTELLKAILCELKELRAAVRQSQVFAPLVEANIREWEQVQAQVTKLEEKLRELDQAIQATAARQRDATEQLRLLPRAASEPEKTQVEQRTLELEMAVKVAGEAMQQHQVEQNRVAPEASRAHARLAELEEGFDSLQRQMRGVAAASSTVCEVEP